MRVKDLPAEDRRLIEELIICRIDLEREAKSINNSIIARKFDISRHVVDTINKVLEKTYGV